MSHLSLSVLGEFQILKDGVPIQTIESDKVRALLAYLAVEADCAHKRESLIGLLWPDYPDPAARHNLRQALFNLRRALDDHTATPPYLVISRAAIQFNRESDYSLDLVEFDRLYPWKRNSGRVRGDSPSITRQLEDMVALYRGEFLQRFYLEDSPEFEEWVLVQRETVHQQMLDVLTHLADGFERRGEYQMARCYASRQLELDPWREEAHSQVMRLLALEGQRSAALAQYEICRKVLAEELAAEPSPQTRELYEQIRAGNLNKAAAGSYASFAPLHNLPVSLTPFLGRERELADLARLIADPDCRCITLIGPGGIGKTRLAVQVAEQHQHQFAHGTAFIPLVSVASAEAVIPAIASSLGYDFSGPADPKVQLLHYLRGKQMLLVLDNLEHLLSEEHHKGAVSELLVDILQKAPQVKLLLTSREALNLQSEWTYEVQGLAFPGPEHTDGSDYFDAIALFVQRARQARPDFVLNEEDKTEVVRLCQLVEGMPLAIELAASWIRILSPAEVAAEVEQSLDFLNASLRDIPERHRSMRAVFDRSWQTLSTDEREVLGRLAVFRGGFQRQAAEQVAGTTLTVLSTLVIRSLVRRTAVGRYDLHELVRQYAASKLAEDPQLLYEVQEKHSVYYLDLLEEKDAKLNSRHQQQAVAELTSDMHNIRAAWDWSIATQQFSRLYRASTMLWYLLELRNWLKEGEATFQKTADAIRANIEESETDGMYQVALNAMLAHCGYFRFRLGRGEDAYAIMAPSATFLRTSAEPFAAIYSVWYLGIVCWQLGRFNEAKENLRQSLALSRQYGKRWYEALASEFLGSLAREEGAYGDAQHYLSEALAIFRQFGDPMMVAHGLCDLGRTMHRQGEFGEAEKILRDSLELARELDCRFAMGSALDVLGQVAYAQGSHEEAHAIFSESAMLFEEIGDTHRLSQVLNSQGLNSMALNQTSGAQNTFKAALRMALDGGLMPAALYALTGLAALNIQQKTSQEVLELVLYVLQHPASTQETKDLGVRLRDDLESYLSMEKIEAAQRYAGSMSLDEAVRYATTSM